MRDTQELTEETKKLAYFAGIIDNKGSLSIGLDNNRNKMYFYEQYRVTGELEILEKLKKEFGGSISTNGQNCKIIWRITADRALEMLEKLRPFVIHRTKLIDSCIEFGRHRVDAAKGVGKPNHKYTKNKLIETASQYRNILNSKEVRKKEIGGKLHRELAIFYNEGVSEAYFGAS